MPLQKEVKNTINSTFLVLNKLMYISNKKPSSPEFHLILSQKRLRSMTATTTITTTTTSTTVVLK